MVGRVGSFFRTGEDLNDFTALDRDEQRIEQMAGGPVMPVPSILSGRQGSMRKSHSSVPGWIRPLGGG